MAKTPKLYPRWLHHPKLESRIFNSPEEARWAWFKGWRDHPFPPENTRKAARLKRWWEKWKWLFEATTLIIGIPAGIIGLVKLLRSP
jgi:hypothetical protein